MYVLSANKNLLVSKPQTQQHNAQANRQKINDIKTSIKKQKRSSSSFTYSTMLQTSYEFLLFAF